MNSPSEWLLRKAFYSFHVKLGNVMILISVFTFCGWIINFPSFLGFMFLNHFTTESVNSYTRSSD